VAEFLWEVAPTCPWRKQRLTKNLLTNTAAIITRQKAVVKRGTTVAEEQGAKGKKLRAKVKTKHKRKTKNTLNAGATNSQFLLSPFSVNFSFYFF